MVKVYRDIPQYFCTYIDTTKFEIDERVPAETIVMMMTVYHPAVKSFRGIRRIVNETEPEAAVFEQYQGCCPRIMDIVISLNKINPPPEFVPVISCRNIIGAISQVSQVIYTVCGRDRIIPVLNQHVIHLPGIRKEKGTGTVMDNICMTKMQV